MKKAELEIKLHEAMNKFFIAESKFNLLLQLILDPLLPKQLRDKYLKMCDELQKEADEHQSQAEEIIRKMTGNEK